MFIYKYLHPPQPEKNHEIITMISDQVAIEDDLVVSFILHTDVL